MIKKLLLSGVLLYTIACNDTGSETTETDSSTTTTSTESMATSSSVANFDESASYVSLNTSKPIKVKRDTTRGYIVDYETNEPLNFFFYNPATNDTFDWSGNVVNNYLLLGDDGTYKLDEDRWRTKVDDDGDVKAKDGDESKIKIDGDGSEIKIKTDTSKIKIDASGTKTKKKD